MPFSFPFEFDYKKPDYTAVFNLRIERLKRIRENQKKDPRTIPLLKIHYRKNPIDFINDWGMTDDPRNADGDQPTYIPFLLFPRQEELIQFTLNLLENKKFGVVPKSREMGVTWVMVALACTWCLFNKGFRVGFGSRKSDYVDKLGDPDSILEKVRYFISNLPEEFRGGWNPRNNGAFMKITFPETASMITGECGDDIGRGGRKTIFILDEAGWVARSERIEASLSQTTRCRLDVSTPRGMANSFAKKCHDGETPRFDMHWRDDPRKNEEWYQEMRRILKDDVIIAQELDLNFNASVEGVIIQHEWVMACIDAHLELDIEPTGERRGALDVADKGVDTNALAIGKSFLIEDLREWSGKTGDIFNTTQKAINFADEFYLENLRYDADGLGAGVRGDARIINEQRVKQQLHEINFQPYHGSGEVVDPEKEVFKEKDDEVRKGIKGRKNKDYFSNFKAQSWFFSKRKFYLTWLAVTEGLPIDPRDLISISSKLPKDLLTKLLRELPQAVAKWGSDGKVVVDKTPDGMPSPNLADSVIIYNAPLKIKRSFYDID